MIKKKNIESILECFPLSNEIKTKQKWREIEKRQNKKTTL